LMRVLARLGRRGIAWTGTSSVALLTGLTWAGIMAARLFVSGSVGLADNGDSRRLMCQLGLRALQPFKPEDFVYPVWIAHRWYGEACGAEGSGEPYRSSELWLLSLARHLTPVLGFPGALDLRVLGILASLLVGAGIGLLVVVLPGRWGRRVLVASVFGLVMADGAVADFFVSPYSEPAALLGSLFLCVVLLWMWGRGSTSWPALAVVALVGAFTMTSQTQAVALFPALALAVLWLPHKGYGPGTASPLGTSVLVRSWCFVRPRLPAVLTVAALLMVAGVVVQVAPTRFNEINAYDQVFNEILVHSADPRADLRWLGVDPALAAARRSNVLSPNSAATSLSYLDFRSHVTRGRIMEFYLSHPDRLFPVFADGLDAMSVWHENYLGTFQANTGHPAGAVETRIGVFTDLFRDQPPAVFVMAWLAMLGFGILAARDRRTGPRERAVGGLAVFLAVAVACELWAVMLSEGLSDVDKHMILTNELFALGVPALLVCVISPFMSGLRAGGPSATQPEVAGETRPAVLVRAMSGQ